MPSAGETETTSSKPTVFLSYASEDREAATSIRDAMAAAGLDVWYDANELGGGDAWDKKIRQQIRECDYFMAVISAQTEARHEGYFRREWRLAVERTLDMADDHAFILPVVIDGTDQAVARVPEKFLSVQWLKAPGGQPNAALSSLCTRLLSGTMFEKPAPRRAPAARAPASAAPFPPATPVPGAPPVVMPVFPTEEPGQRVKFWVHVVVWAAQSVHFGFRRLPKWLRLIIVLWCVTALLSKGCSSDRVTTKRVTPEAGEKLKAIAEKYQGSTKGEDVGKLGLAIAHELAKEVGDSTGDSKPLLAVPFSAPPGESPEAKLADSTFAILYGRMAISHEGSVSLSKETLPSLTAEAAVERGKAAKSTYVIFGGVENPGPTATLKIEIVKVSDSAVMLDKSYPVAGADAPTIAAEIDAKVPAGDDN